MHTIGVEGPKYMVFRQQINGIDNANYILNNTTFLAHKNFFVTIAFILYALSKNQNFLKQELPTAFCPKTIHFICY